MLLLNKVIGLFDIDRVLLWQSTPSRPLTSAGRRRVSGRLVVAEERFAADDPKIRFSDAMGEPQ